MLKNYVLIAWRNIRRQPLYAVFNIMGLAVGISASLFILLYLHFELNYDQFHSEKDRLFRLQTDELKMRSRDIQVSWSTVPRNFAALARQDFPEIEATISFHQFFSEGEVNFVHEGKTTSESAVYAVDSNLLQVLGYELIAGNPKAALSGPNKIVVSESLAKRLFGTTAALGKMLSTQLTHIFPDTENNYTLEISGVFKDLPANTHLTAEALLSAETDPHLNDHYFNRFNATTYVLLHPGVDPAEFAPKLTGIYERYLDPEREPVMVSAKHRLLPITAIHMAATGGYTYLYIFSGIGLLLLLIAMISYINMVTAQASRRALEVGLRKVLGSLRQHLIFQFLTESLLLTSVALALALGLVILFIHPLNELLNLQLSIAQLLSPAIVSAGIGVLLLVGVLGGSYPAFFLSSFAPITVMKGKRSKGSSLRSALVGIQFMVVIFVLICTGMIYEQLQFMRHKDLGFEQEQIIRLGLEGADVEQKYPILRQGLLQHTRITGVGAGSFMPGMGQMGRRPISAEGTAGLEPQFVRFGQIDDHYLETMEIELLDGRNFSPEFPADDTTAVIVNEAFCRNFGLENPIGARIRFGDSGNPNFETIVGLVKDFHQSSLHDPIESQVFFRGTGLQVAIKVQGDIQTALSNIETSWNKSYPATPFNYEFLNEELATIYETDQIRGKIFFALSLISMFIAFLGLFGLASYVTTQRDKELAVRKIVGAKSRDLVQLLTKDFILLVLLAAVPAAISSWFLIKNWLADFAYQTPMNYGIFLGVFVFTLLLVALTTGLHAVRAASLNPAEALKRE